MRPLLTVAIPTYNGGDNLLRAVRSCRNINLPRNEVEILVVDNCSTDNSINELEKVKKKFSNLRIVRNEKNIGRIGNWNKCLDLAEGKYLIFLFSNDEINRSMDFRYFINILENDHEINMIYNRAVFIYGDKIFLSDIFFDKGKKVKTYEFIEEVFYKNLNFTSFGILQQHIYRKSIIDEYNIRFLESIDRTTDRMFICDVCMAKDGYIFFGNEIQCKWYLSSNRYHYRTHVDINSIDLVDSFNKNWGQEYLANKYILEKINVKEEDIVKAHYSKFYNSYIISKLKKVLGKSLTPDELLLPAFIKLLEIKLNYRFMIYTKLKSLFFITKKVVQKVIKTINFKDNFKHV
jgi:glycosyltransferase involved in cell wall biosynthesis